MTVLNDFIKVNCRLYSVNTGAPQTPHPPALSRLAGWPWRERFLGHEKGSCFWESENRRPFGSIIHHSNKEMEVREVKPLVSGHTQMPKVRAGVRSRVFFGI